MSSSVIGRAVDDAEDSPYALQYFGNWGLGEPIPQHYGQTAHYTRTPGSQALLFFRGTSVTYYADQQASLSIATVSVDGLPPDKVNLTSSISRFQAAVWSKNLTDGDHQLVIEHVGPAQTDIMIDYINILSTGYAVSASAGPGASDVTSLAVFIDDTDPNLQFSPNNWRFVTEGLFFNRSSQVTQTRGASLQVKFNGTAIWYFTDVGPDHGNVTIRIDEDDDDGEIASG
ncbi:hypothetical protein FRC07_012105, partial [Ceratobasidium sp. 392]